MAEASGVPRILEWEGSMCRRRRGVGVGRRIPLRGEGDTPLPLPAEGRVWGGGCP